VSNFRQNATGILRAYRAAVAGPKKILIVEGNEDNRALLTLILARDGYDVAEAATALAALHKARVFGPDLVIMGLCLPGMSGDEATAHLKAEPSTKHIPVIINTGLPSKSTRVENAIAAGAVEVLYKPTSVKAFREVVNRYLGEAACSTS
jgi:CheY-like chemotaxis protein